MLLVRGEQERHNVGKGCAGRDEEGTLLCLRIEGCANVSTQFRELLEATPDMNAAVAAIRSLTEVMEGSEGMHM